MRKVFTFLFVSLSCFVFSQPYNYRGMHLDVSRHFFPKEVVFKYLDTLQQCGINYFHWHLTDDQGWRIEIKKYPLLTQTGAWRKEKDGTTYGGFYTQQEIKEVVKYASQKGITIIPEIDLPGHSSAAIAAYPFLSSYNSAKEVPNRWGIFTDILCPADSVFQFLFGVMDEVCALFPSPYMHIGGDEVPKQAWKQSSFVTQLMRQKNLKNYEAVQHYFMKTMEDYLATKNKRCIMWGEALRGGVSDSTIIMSWRGKGAGIKAAKQGKQVIMAPRFKCYFDYPQSVKDNKPAWWMTYTPVKAVARFTPKAKTLSAAQNKNILGGEATLWTEYVTSEKELWHQLMPRLRVLGEKLNSHEP